MSDTKQAVAEPYSETLKRAEFLRREGRVEEAMRLANEHLNEHLEDPAALYLVGHALLESGKTGLAFSLYKQFLALRPNVPGGWNNLGRCYFETNKLDEAEMCFRRAIKIDPNDFIAYSNLGLIELNRCHPEKSIEWSQKSLDLSPTFSAAKHNLGLAHLMAQNWPEGWANYEASVGRNADRRERVYGDEPRWDGEKGKCVVAYGEQGLGDEISFASMVPDLVRDCRETVVECDVRLEGLFRRSFPQAHVYGTRYKEMIDWADKHKPEGRVAFGSLGKFYRKTAADFDGKPYLVADPERRIQWRALLDSLGPKPKVGIAWQGGILKTGKKWRSVTLDALMPVLKQDATFISLQYKHATAEIEALEQTHGIKIHHWPRAVEAKDYDETAALVAELDAVVSVTTAAIHLAGGLGVKAYVLTPMCPMWRYGLTGEQMPWYQSVELIRQQKAGNWHDPIAEAAYRLRNFLRSPHDHQHLRQPDDRACELA